MSTLGDIKKIGRPYSKNTKREIIKVRFNKKDKEDLEKISKSLNLSMSDVLRNSFYRYRNDLIDRGYSPETFELEFGKR